MAADSALLPIGSQDFETLRSSGQIYVDKTQYVFELARQRRQFFLSRPRRFGKSLLLSTFASLFQHGVSAFNGLAIASRWKEPTYNVLSLDFSVLKAAASAEEFLAGLNAELARACVAADLAWDADRPDPLQQFGDFLSQQGPNSLVLLIDEYDAPLAAALDRPELYAEIQRYFEIFYGFVKAQNRCLRFFFITGILRFQHTSIFSAFNSLQDISMDPDFGQMLGYTADEIEKYFADFLQEAAEKRQTDRASLLQALQEHYDGFCFDQCASSHVFAPWSVMQFFNKPQLGFQNYWYRSGGSPTVLLRYCQQHDLVALADLQQTYAVALDSLQGMSDIDRIDPFVLLFQTGYLSIRSVEQSDVYLGYPNEEVRTSLAQFFAEKFWPQRNVVRGLAKEFFQTLEQRDFNRLSTILNQVISQIDYQDFPLDKESAVRAAVQVFLLGTGLQPQVEVHSSQGRSDLEFDAGSWHWVVEFKYVPKDADVSGALLVGHEQMLRRDYGAAHSGNRQRAVFVFSQESRKFVMEPLDTGTRA